MICPHTAKMDKDPSSEKKFKKKTKKLLKNVKGKKERKSY